MIIIHVLVVLGISPLGFKRISTVTIVYWLYSVNVYTTLYMQRCDRNKVLFYSNLFYSIYSILFYSILFYSILFYSILFYSILFYSILFYSILFYSILFYSMLFYSILFYSILFYSILFYSILFSSRRTIYVPLFAVDPIECRLTRYYVIRDVIAITYCCGKDNGFVVSLL